MITLDAVFWGIVFLFGIIGAMRGWAQELLVSFSMILGVFIITVLGILPFISGFLTPGFFDLDGTVIQINQTTFWGRILIMFLFTYFGYQTPRRVQRIAAASKRSERLQDTLLGIIVGAFNGYMIFGIFWFFLIQFNYGLEGVVAPVTDSAQRIIEVLPPEWLSGNFVYFAVAIAFAFVVIVFV